MANRQEGKGEYVDSPDWSVKEPELSDTEQWAQIITRNSSDTENTSLRPQLVSNLDDKAVIGGIQDVASWGSHETTMLFHPCDEKAMPTGKAATLSNNKSF